MSVNLLQTPIEYLKGVGPQRGELLRKELGIHRYEDLLNFYPNRYIDRTRYYQINELNNNPAEVQIIGKVVHLKTVEFGKGKKRMVASFTDGTGVLELNWFQGHKWIRDSLKLNTPYVIFGKVTNFNGQYSMAHPEMIFVEIIKMFANYSKRMSFDFVFANKVFGNELQLDKEQFFKF